MVSVTTIMDCCSLTVCVCVCVDKLRECFEAYGEVTECSIMKDPVQKRSRCVACC